MTGMTHLKWTTELETGLDTIDLQHRKIVDFINRLIDLRVSKDMSEILSVINDLVEYTISHFNFEEELQAKAEYSKQVEHKMAHETFKNHLIRYQKRAMNGDREVVTALLAFLKAWLVGHIQNEDMAYVPAVRRVARNSGQLFTLVGTLKKVFTAGIASEA